MVQEPLSVADVYDDNWQPPDAAPDPYADTDEFGNYYDPNAGTWISPEGFTLNDQGNWVDPVGGGIYDTQTGQWYDPSASAYDPYTSDPIYAQAPVYPSYGELETQREQDLVAQEQFAPQLFPHEYPQQYATAAGPAYEIGPSGLETQREQMLVAEQQPAGYIDPWTGFYVDPTQDPTLLEQLRQERQGETAYGGIPGALGAAGLSVLGDIGQAGLGALQYAVEPYGQGLEALGQIPVPQALSGYASEGYTGDQRGFIPLGEVLGAAIPWAPAAKEIVGDIAEPLRGPLPVGFARGAAAALVPEQQWELLPEFVPAIGAVPGTASFAKQALGEGLDAAVRAAVGFGARNLDEAAPIVRQLLRDETGSINPEDIAAAFARNRAPEAAGNVPSQPLSAYDAEVEAAGREQAERIAEYEANIRPGITPGKVTMPSGTSVGESPVLFERGDYDLDELLKAPGDTPLEKADSPQFQGAREQSLNEFYDQRQREVDELLAGISPERGPGSFREWAAQQGYPSTEPLPPLESRGLGPEGLGQFQLGLGEARFMLPEPPVENLGRALEPGGRIGGPDVGFMARTPESAKAAAASGIGLADWVNLPRGLMAGADFSSAYLRQMIPLAGTHPEQYAKALGHALGLLKSEDYYWGLMRELSEDSLWAKMRFDGPKMSFYKGSDFMSREEQIVAQDLLSKIPGIGRIYDATGRQYSGSINAFRSGVVDQFVKHRLEDFLGRANAARMATAKARGYPSPLNISPEQYRQLRTEVAKYSDLVSKATGWGNLGPLERSKAAGALSIALFSPRAAIGKIQWAGGLIDRPFSPVWNQTVKDMAGFLGLGSTAVALAVLAGASTNLDPSNTDFGKMTFGPVHLDIWGGFQPLARTVYRLASGEVNGRQVERDILGLLNSREVLNYFRNRLSPSASLFVDQALGQVSPVFRSPEYFNEGVLGLTGGAGRPLDRALQYMIPLWVQDVANGIRVDGLRGAAVGALSAFGAGTQFYDRSVSPLGQKIAASEKILGNEEAMRTAGIPENIIASIRGQDYLGLGSREKQAIESQLRPEDVAKWTEAERKAHNEYRAALDQQSTIREQWNPVFSALETKLKDGQSNPYLVNQAIKAAEAEMQKELRTVEFPESKSEREKSDIQKLQAAYYGMYDKAKDPETGKINWDILEKAQADFLTGVRQSDAALGDRLAWNVESRPNPNDPPILQRMDEVKPLLNAYYGLPEDQRAQWRVQNPSTEGLLVAYGYLGTVHSPQAAQVAQALTNQAPDVTIRIQDALAVPNNANYPGARAARDAYFNLPQEQQADWLASHPQENAILVLSGYISSAKSIEAYNLITSGR